MCTISCIIILPLIVACKLCGIFLIWLIHLFIPLLFNSCAGYFWIDCLDMVSFVCVHLISVHCSFSSRKPLESTQNIHDIHNRCALCPGARQERSKRCWSLIYIFNIYHFACLAHICHTSMRGLEMFSRRGEEYQFFCNGEEVWDVFSIILLFKYFFWRGGGLPPPPPLLDMRIHHGVYHTLWLHILCTCH